MTTPITITIPHELGRTDARRRIETGFTRMLRQLAGTAGHAANGGTATG
jgi:hypothetical protein